MFVQRDETERRVMRRVLPALVVAFIALCAVGLWLTREPARSGERTSSPSAAADARVEAPAPELPPPAHPIEPSAPPPTVRPTPVDAGSAQGRTPSDEELLSRRAAPPSPLVVGSGATQPPARPDEAGRIDSRTIEDAEAELKPLVVQCFEDAADRFPPPQKVTLRFTVTGRQLRGTLEDGTLLDATIVDPWVQACFLDAMTDTTFEVPGDGRVTVTLPVVFGKQGADAGDR